jgi:putative transposase
VISISGKGNCFDSAMVGTFFKTLKNELLWRTTFQARAEAIVALARYIDGYYNPCRRHSVLAFSSPIQFERGFNHQTALY